MSEMSVQIISDVRMPQCHTRQMNVDGTTGIEIVDVMGSSSRMGETDSDKLLLDL